MVAYRESDLPPVNWDTTNQWYDYYHGYAKLEKEGVKPLYPYGFGLSYTAFSLNDASFEVKGDVIEAECTVTNTGDREGEEVVQLYVGFSRSAVDRPIKLLRGFSRVRLNPGESKKVKIECPTEKLKWYTPTPAALEHEHMIYEAYIGTSSDPKDLIKGCFTL